MTPPESPILKGMKSGLSMLLEDEATPISLRKKSLLNSASKSIDHSEYTSDKIASFSESFFEYAPKPTNLYPESFAEEVSESSLFSNVEIYDVSGGKAPDSFASNSSLSPSAIQPSASQDNKSRLGIAELLHLILEDIQNLKKKPLIIKRMRKWILCMD